MRRGGPPAERPGDSSPGHDGDHTQRSLRPAALRHARPRMEPPGRRLSLGSPPRPPAGRPGDSHLGTADITHSEASRPAALRHARPGFRARRVSALPGWIAAPLAGQADPLCASSGVGNIPGPRPSRKSQGNVSTWSTGRAPVAAAKNTPTPLSGAWFDRFGPLGMQAKILSSANTLAF